MILAYATLSAVTAFVAQDAVPNRLDVIPFATILDPDKVRVFDLAVRKVLLWVTYSCPTSPVLSLKLISPPLLPLITSDPLWVALYIVC